MAAASSKIFVINLDGSEGRWQHSQNQLSNACIERIQGVNGSALDSVQLHQHFDESLNRQHYHKMLTVGEIGCYLSHRKAWQTIVDQKLDFAVVLEDDFILTSDIQQVVANIGDITHPWDYIKLAQGSIERKAIFSESIDNAELVIYDKIPSTTCAQAVSYQGARKLLAGSSKFGRPVDADIQHWWEHELLVFGLRPYPFAADLAIQSDIETKGQRKHIASRRLFKARKQLSFYFINKLQTANRLNQMLMPHDNAEATPSNLNSR